MVAIQISLADSGYRKALRDELAGSDSGEVSCVDRPDPGGDGVLVLDRQHLDMLALPISNPERVVLISTDGGADVAKAWEAGVCSVVERSAPLNTAVLAVLSATLRLPRSWER